MSKLLPELFPADGKNKYRYLVVFLILAQFLFKIPALEGYEIIFLYLMFPVGAWLVYNLIPEHERKF